MTSVPATEKVWCTIRRSSVSGTFCGTGSRAARSAATLGHSACTTWQSSSSCVPAGCVRQSSFMRGQHACVEGERDEPPDGERHVRQRRARCLRRWPHRQARVCRREPEGARKRTGEPLPVAERAVESGDEPEAALLRRRDQRPAAHAQHDRGTSSSSQICPCTDEYHPPKSIVQYHPHKHGFVPMSCLHRRVRHANRSPSMPKATKAKDTGRCGTLACKGGGGGMEGGGGDFREQYHSLGVLRPSVVSLPCPAPGL